MFGSLESEFQDNSSTTFLESEFQDLLISGTRKAQFLHFDLSEAGRHIQVAVIQGGIGQCGENPGKVAMKVSRRTYVSILLSGQ